MNNGGYLFKPYLTNPFEFPEKVNRFECDLRDKTDFVDFIVNNEWVQRRIGMTIKRKRRGDDEVRAVILGEEKIPINVCIEFRAAGFNFKQNKFGQHDLLLSFYRNPDTRIIRGVPNWSFYVGSTKSEYYSLCLMDDVLFDFVEKTKQTKIGQPAS